MMAAKAIDAAPEGSIGDAAKYMHGKLVGCLAITLEGAVTAIATDRDVFIPLHKDGTSPSLRAFIAEVA